MWIDLVLGVLLLFYVLLVMVCSGFFVWWRGSEFGSFLLSPIQAHRLGTPPNQPPNLTPHSSGEAWYDDGGGRSLAAKHLAAAHLHCRPINSTDLDLVAGWNQHLQIDEGAPPMEVAAITARLRRWLANEYQGLLFELDSTPVGYALFRPTDPDLKRADGIYLRQFFIAREHRRRGLGSQAFVLFVDHAVSGRRVVLEALASNPGGQAFWQSLGLRVYSVAFERLSEATDHQAAEAEGP